MIVVVNEMVGSGSDADGDDAGGGRDGGVKVRAWLL